MESLTKTIDYKLLFPGSLFLIDKEGIVKDILLSNQWPSFLKKPVLHASVFSVFQVMVQTEMLKRLSSVLEKGEPMTYKWKVVSPQRDYYAMLTMRRYSNDMALASFQDISEMEIQYKIARIQQKSTLFEEQIWQWNQILNIILAHSTFFIFVKDVKNDFRYIFNNVDNNTAIGLLSDYRGKTDFELFPQTDAERYRQEDLLVVTDKKPHHFIHKEKTPNGHDIYIDTLKIYIDEKDRTPLLVGIVRDITEQEVKKHELELKINETKNADSIKTNFIANISKEIRSPLNAIIGFSGLLATSDDTQARESYKNIIEENSRRLTLMIDELLDLTRINEGIMELNFSTVSPFGLCEQLVHVFADIKHKQTKIIFDESPAELMIEADGVRLYQVMSYLLNSACRLTFDGIINYGFYSENTYSGALSATKSNLKRSV